MPSVYFIVFGDFKDRTTISPAWFEEAIPIIADQKMWIKCSSQTTNRAISKNNVDKPQPYPRAYVQDKVH